MIAAADNPLGQTSLLFLACENRGTGLIHALESMGHIVHPCHGTEEALRVALSGTVGAALILSGHDLKMARDFCHRVRLNKSDMSIITLLPYSLAPHIGLRIELLEAGADLCLASSTSSRELSARLSSQMRLNRRVGRRRQVTRGDYS